jgi:hypothetical protein
MFKDIFRVLKTTKHGDGINFCVRLEKFTATRSYRSQANIMSNK